MSDDLNCLRGEAVNYPVRFSFTGHTGELSTGIPQTAGSVTMVLDVLLPAPPQVGMLVDLPHPKSWAGGGLDGAIKSLWWTHGESYVTAELDLRWDETPMGTYEEAAAEWAGLPWVFDSDLTEPFNPAHVQPEPGKKKKRK